VPGESAGILQVVERRVRWEVFNRGSRMNKALLREFAHPPAKYRGKPFWAWNGRLEPEELRRQVRIMKRMGFGGFFMHSRVGLETPYLSAEWFECIKACIDEAEKTGLEAWLYDEDRWPSGSAGGLATKDRRYRARHLVMEEVQGAGRLRWSRDVLAAFTAKVDGSNARDVRQLRRGERLRRLPRGRSLLVFRVEVMEPSSWYNGCAYLDTLSHEAVRKFIEITHEAYRKRIEKHFGKRVPGIFTDEPNYMTVESLKLENRLPWTSRLPSVFKERYGYDILPHLAELYFDVDGRRVTPARLDYHDCVTHLLADAFAKQIGEWCEKNKLLLTGHALWEELPSSIARSTGSVMRFLEHLQVPGMDVLTELKREYDTAKQVSSVARQLGRRWRLSEMYSRSGWDFPFAGHKAIGDWQTALGINLRCHHLAWYSMEGQRKRDRPASIFYQSPWWEDYAEVEDYFARVHAVMSRGEEVRDLLVIHPVESAWAMCKKGWFDGRRTSAEMAALDMKLVELRDSLLAANIDFDYGDEEMLGRQGRVVRGGGGTELRVGKARYKAVIVPPLVTMRRTTLDLLEGLRDAGGSLVFAGEVCRYVGGEPSSSVAEFARRCASAPAKGQRLVEAVETTCRRLSIRDDQGKEIVPALHLLREDRDWFYLFVCNVGYDFVRRRRGAVGDIPVRERRSGFPRVSIRGFVGCDGKPIELDPKSGGVFASDARRWGGGWEMRTSLPRLGSRLFAIPKRRQRVTYPKRRVLRPVRRRRLDGGAWRIALSEWNNLVLDRPRYKIGSGAWRGPEEILKVDMEVRDRLGIPRRDDRMVQPWARKKSGSAKRVRVELRYEFAVRGLPTGELWLGLEQPWRFEAEVNGERVSTENDAGWWTDSSLRKVPFGPSLLRRGKNEVRLVCEYDESLAGLETVYLLGEFGTAVRGTRVTVEKLPSTLTIGDWTKQGLAFYSGRVKYAREVRVRLKRGERLFVQVPEYAGVAVAVSVNGKRAGVIAWEPNEVDVTELIEGECVELGLDVLGHRRNSHGPLHFVSKEPSQVTPDCFTTKGESWRDGYQLVPCGLIEEPLLAVRV